MLSRSSRLHHPSGVAIDTPLLVPSFSSKGFGTNSNGVSEIKEIFAVVSEYLTDTMLVSAYDLANGNLEPIENAITDLTIVDSGGYEVSAIHDLSAVYRQAEQPTEWTIERLQVILDIWPDRIPAVFVSYDHPTVRQPLQDQIESSRSLFARYPRQWHTLLIKPETKNQQYVQIKNVIRHIDDLSDFDMVGLTEKELGSSIIDRMKNIAEIRLAMDDANVAVPIHIFGSLDPITSVLYFLSGAEVFDGLTWLRYGYGHDVACYQHNYGALQVGIHKSDEFIIAKTMQENLGFLLELTHKMQRYLLDGNFDKLGTHAAFFRDSFDLLRTKSRRVH